MNVEKANKLDKLLKGVTKLPIWVWQVLLGIVCVFSRLFQTKLAVGYANLILPVLSTKTMVIVVSILVAIIMPLWTRLLARVDYSLGSRIYFRRTAYLPDYNMRRLPIPYNDFLKVVLFIYTLVNAFTAVINVALFKAPYAIYLISIPTCLAKIGGYVFGAFLLRRYVEDWQLSHVYFSLGIPSLVMLCLSIGGL